MYVCTSAISYAIGKRITHLSFRIKFDVTSNNSRHQLIIILTSILRDKVNNMLLASSLQGFQKLVALIFVRFRRQQIQQVVASFIRRFVAGTKLAVLFTSQSLQTEEMVQQPEIWLN